MMKMETIALNAKLDYATSDDGENCISFQNCIDLGNGNEKCGTYYDWYYINNLFFINI